ncbi:MAG: tRNA (adenine-N1)-methyltransferase [Acidilobaceae archaeon]
MKEEVVKRGDPVVVLVMSARASRHYYFRIYEDKVYMTSAGIFRGTDIIGMEYGSKLELAEGYAYILKPTLRELLEHFMERATQVVYPKDSSLMSFEAGLKPGMRVLEGGVGSGFLTVELARIVCPGGKVYAFDIKPENIAIASKNLELVGLRDCVELRLGDVKKLNELVGLDAAFLDIPDPWEALEPLWKALKLSAPLVIFVPTMNQLIKLSEAIECTPGWVLQGVKEVSERQIEVTRESIRPSSFSPFTGYIILLRKVVKT